MQQICDDLRDEHEALDRLVAPLDEGRWRLPTPSEGWTIADQVSHLWFFDDRALLALTDEDAFARDARVLLESGGTELSVEPGRSISGADLLERWRHARSRLLDIAARLDPGARVPWYGPAMGARSFITARLMETWAHGYDVADALGVVPVPTDRLRHVAHIGVRARPFSYLVRGRQVPDGEVFVDLVSPAGERWTWGDESCPDRVAGDALDFCLVVTQRRHLADTGLVAEGALASDWLAIAQAFAGPPGPGREPSGLTGG